MEECECPYHGDGRYRDCLECMRMQNDDLQAEINRVLDASFSGVPFLTDKGTLRDDFAVCLDAYNANLDQETFTEQMLRFEQMAISYMRIFERMEKMR